MKKLITLLFVLCSVNLLRAEEYVPTEVQRIIDIRKNEINKINEKYQDALERQKERYIKLGEFEHAKVVDELLTKHAQSEGLSGYIYTINREGSAGYWHRGNVYEFNVDKLASSARLRCWIKGGGDESDSNGAITLIDTEGNKHTIYRWNPARLKKIMEDTSSPTYKGGGLLAVDLESLIKEKGIYKIVFKYERGKNALEIKKVELETY